MSNENEFNRKYRIDYGQTIRNNWKYILYEKVTQNYNRQQLLSQYIEYGGSTVHDGEIHIDVAKELKLNSKGNKLEKIFYFCYDRYLNYNEIIELLKEILLTSKNPQPKIREKINQLAQDANQELTNLKTSKYT